MEKLKSTLRVLKEADLESIVSKSATGPITGERVSKRLAGGDQNPTERIWAGAVTWKPGAWEQMHWHLIEVFYYVISGRAVMKDIEGKTYNIGPGTVIYAPPGIAGAHEWDYRDGLQLLAFRASTNEAARIQFAVDPSTKQSFINYDSLIRGAGGQFKKSLYTI